MQRKRWTEDEINILKKELKENKNRDEIALILNRTKSSIVSLKSKGVLYE